MFSTIGQLLPGFTCLAFTAYYITSRAVKRNPYFLALTIIATLFFICDAGYVLSSDNSTELTIVDFFAQYTATALGPNVFHFLHYENCGKRPPRWTYLSYLPSIIIGTISAICILAIGPSDIGYVIDGIERNNYSLPQGWTGFYKAYFYNNVIVNWYTMIAFEIFLAGDCLYLIALRLRKRDGSGKRMIVMCTMLLIIVISHLLKMTLRRTALIEMDAFNGILGLIWAAGFAIIGREYLTRPSTPMPAAFANIPKRVRKVSLMEQVNDIMDNCKCYLNPEVSLNSVADELGTNRTYLSALFNKEFNCSFREYVTRKRLEFAKSYMLSNPRASITEVAEASGFANLSQFSRKFKEAEGISPASWLKNHK